MENKRTFKHKVTGSYVMQGDDGKMYDKTGALDRNVLYFASSDEFEEVFDRSTPEGLLKDIYNNDHRFRMCDYPFGNTDMIFEAMEQWAEYRVQQYAKEISSLLEQQTSVIVKIRETLEKKGYALPGNVNLAELEIKLPYQRANRVVDELNIPDIGQELTKNGALYYMMKGLTVKIVGGDESFRIVEGVIKDSHGDEYGSDQIPDVLYIIVR